MAVTSLEKIKEKAAMEVTLPGWDNEPFVCKLKRVSLMEAIAKGEVPNPLIATVTEVFEGKLKSDEDEESKKKKLFEGLNFFCKAAMVEPTFEEVESIVSLTEEQRYMIYKFAVDGVRLYEPSVAKTTNILDNKHVNEVQ